MPKKTANELWRYTSVKGLKPLPKTSVSKWADEYRMLSAGSAEPGRWKTSRAPYQQEIMDAFTQPGVKTVVVKSAAQIGKALDITTPIPTPDGWKCMADIHEGDMVFDENGRPTKVSWESATMVDRPCYRMVFSDGAEIVADAEHKWTVDIDRKNGCETKTLTTREMLNDYKHNGRHKYAIPVAGAMELPEKQLKIEPYTLGVWLGDGNSCSAQVSAFKEDIEIADYIREAGYTVLVRDDNLDRNNTYNLRINPRGIDGECSRGHKIAEVGRNSAGHCRECARQMSMANKWRGVREIKVDDKKEHTTTFRKMLADLNLLDNKHIPAEYLRASKKQRLALLQGLMDTDGHITPKSHCEITFKSKTLIEGTSELLHSLGIKHTVKEKTARCTNSPSKKEYIVWRISFTAYDCMEVFRLKRKKNLLKCKYDGRYTETFRRRITSILPVESRPVKCIGVESASHLYLAGEAMVPTHNSDIMNNVIGRFAHLDPCAIMMIQPTIDLAQDYSKTRISPMLRDTKVLNGLFYEAKKNEDGVAAKTRDGNNTILSKIFPGGRLIMCGANSPAGLASRPVRILLADEVDRFPDSAGTEGDPVDLASKRMTTFWNAVMGLFSTPTNEGSSRIDEEYIAGTQEEWQYECPNCQTYHVLKHTDMDTQYEEHKDRLGRTTVTVHSVKWRCPDCGFSFTEREMRDAPQKYVAQNPAALANGIRSFFINGFTSPWLSWPKIMLEWYKAKGDPAKEKVVMNTRFGESYRQIGAFEDEMVFMRRRERYEAELPHGVLFLTAAVDTQDNRLEYEVCGWGVDEECWGIEKNIILGRPDKKETWEKLDAVLDKVYTFADGTGLKISRTFIDSGGHYTSNVYKYCEQNFSKQRFAIKGQGGPGIPLNYKIARAHGSNIPLVMLGVDDGKQQVMNRLALKLPGPQYFHFPEDDDELGQSKHGYDQLYFKGLISEHKKVVKKNGQIREMWEPVKKDIRNEPLDLRVYNLAAVQSCKPNWAKLHENIKSQMPAAEGAPRAKISSRIRSKAPDDSAVATARPRNRFSRRQASCSRSYF